MTLQHKWLLFLKRFKTKKVDHINKIKAEDEKLIGSDYFLNFLVGRERELDKQIEEIFGYNTAEREKKKALTERRYEVREIKEIYKNAK